MQLLKLKPVEVSKEFKKEPKSQMLHYTLSHDALDIIWNQFIDGMNIR